MKSMTRQKELHEGKSVWEHSTLSQIRTSKLKTSLRADVVIVGGGITGALLADALVDRYEQVVLIDSRRPARGSTMASTALLQYEIDTPLTELSEQIGEEKAARAWRRSYLSTQRLIAHIRRDKIRCARSRNALASRRAMASWASERSTESTTGLMPGKQRRNNTNSRYACGALISIKR